MIPIVLNDVAETEPKSLGEQIVIVVEVHVAQQFHTGGNVGPEALNQTVSDVAQRCWNTIGKGRCPVVVVIVPIQRQQPVVSGNAD